MTTYTLYAMAAWKPCGAWPRVGSIVRSNAERRAPMEHYRPVPGTPLKDLDTPCLLIDLDAVEHNFRLIADTYQDTVCKMRTHVKNLKSPILAHMQIRGGGSVGGACGSKVADA